MENIYDWLRLLMDQGVRARDGARSRMGAVGVAEFAGAW